MGWFKTGIEKLKKMTQTQSGIQGNNHVNVSNEDSVSLTSFQSEECELDVPLKRGRGRPKGGKNRPRELSQSESSDEERRKPGRPAFRPFDLPSKQPMKVNGNPIAFNRVNR